MLRSFAWVLALASKPVNIDNEIKKTDSYFYHPLKQPLPQCFSSEHMLKATVTANMSVFFWPIVLYWITLATEILRQTKP